MPVPLPPSSPDPLIETWPAGRPIVRVHRLGDRPTQFNERTGAAGRFHPIVAGDGSRIPWLYGAEDDEGAICETVFHDVPFVAGAIASEAALKNRAIGTVAPRRDLSLAVLAGPGLRRLGLERADLIDTGPTDYPDTASWAQALHDATPVDGLVWMARPSDRRQSLVLFGDRINTADLVEVEASVPLALGVGRARVIHVATLAGITIVPVA